MKKYSEKDLRCALAYGIGYGQSNPEHPNLANLHLIGSDFIKKKLPKLKKENKSE